ncbi:fructosamine kinase family protein [Mycobacterium sp. smrl_JER01]|uniref:fructosamine kinase family protein n=1 Tax=Mycobacterium sp. smrl_JER01 TaxID=3402633 RepID=UPI003AD3F74A
MPESDRSSSARPFVKQNPQAPRGFFACEAAGLRWLAAADGGVPCARVLAVDDVSLTLERLTPAAPGRAAAREFGIRLARTHDAGADGFGAPPAGWTGAGYFGPLGRPLPMAYRRDRTWGVFYAHRLTEMAARAELDPQTRASVDRVIDRCGAGDFDDGTDPARLHGDLWSGNVMWTPQGVVLIDPAAHGGHRESDLAMLALFGCPHLDEVLAGYQQRRPLHPGWQHRVGLHQLYPLLAHVVLFGGGYLQQTREAADSVS